MHHTGTPNSITDYPGLARSIFTHEVNNGYIDIAYNWLIDPRGRIYEGRWAQDYPRGVPHTGESNRKNVQGAHALHFNTNTIGIGLMGDYSNVGPSAAMVEALITLMTWKCARWGIDPLGATPYFTSQGARSSDCATSAATATRTRLRVPASTVQAMLPRLAHPGCVARRDRRAPATGSRPSSGEIVRVRQPAQRGRAPTGWA